MDDETGDLREALDRLSVRQVQFVIARPEAKNDAEAARAVGLHPQTVYGWRNRADVHRAVRLSLQEVLARMQGELLEVAGQALEMLRAELRRSSSRDGTDRAAGEDAAQRVSPTPEAPTGAGGGGEGGTAMA
ncbi:MAG: hypothetical protein GX649_19680 [Chloroflexi bacterium]|nr:hypothetical protein [Chloroflexota bacterium]